MFGDLVVSRFCQCCCAVQVLNRKKKLKALAVDLDAPDARRNSSRWIAYLGACETCRLPLTVATTFGGCSLTGEAAIRQAAKKEAATMGVNIAWPSVLCRASDVEALPPL